MQMNKFRFGLAVAFCLGMAVTGSVVAATSLSPSISDKIENRKGPPTVDLPDGQKARFLAAPGEAPLVVDLHQWGGGHKGFSGTDERLDFVARDKGWNLIRPDVVDLANDCRADHVASRINDAIAYAKAHAKVSKVIVVGGSGGGYMALVAYMKGAPVDEYFVWVPISDLPAWERQHRADWFGETLRRCAPDLAAGSPINMPEPARKPPLHIFAGVDDGFGASPRNTGKRFVGVVLPTHSIRFFNRFAGPAKIGEDDIRALVEERTDFDHSARLSDRDVLLQRSAGNISLTIFDGAHEVLVKPTAQQIAAGL